MMQRTGWRAWAAVGAVLLGLAPGARAERLKVGMVSDGGPFNDAGFNQNCKEGLERAMSDFKVFGYFRESFKQEDSGKKLTELAEKNYRLIIGVGYRIAPALGEVAQKYTNIWFVAVDGEYEKPLPNVMTLAFNVDECAFPAGYLAAAWADFKDPLDPMVAFVGGIEVDSVTRFTVPYQAGVKYYNSRHNRKVKVKGAYAGGFNDPEKGAELAEALMEEGADVIFGVGSVTGNGALAAAKQRGKWGIGVDVDQYYSLPDVQDILLTSCLKRMNNAVYEVVKNAADGVFEGGGEYRGSLANKGVGLAPFHSFKKKIPETIQQELADIQQAIQDGKLKTGWPPAK